MVNDTQQRCECGRATGERCAEVVGPDAIDVAWMPEHVRESHAAAGYDGIGSLGAAAGAWLLRCAPGCAYALLDDANGWARVERDHGARVVRLPDGREVPAERCVCGDGSCSACDDDGWAPVGGAS